MEGPRLSFESLGHFADMNGISRFNAYQRNLLNLPDPPMDSALADFFSDSSHAHYTTDEYAAELAADAPPHVLPPVVDFRMFQAAQQNQLLRAESSSRPEKLHSVSSAQPVAQRAGSEFSKPLLPVCVLLHARFAHDVCVIQACGGSNASCKAKRLSVNLRQPASDTLRYKACDASVTGI